MAIYSRPIQVKEKNIDGGNMASILLCEDTDVDNNERDSSVIIKMFNKPNIGDEDLQKQVFNREVESLDKLNHKNIVRILDRGFDESFQAFFIVLEYIQGKNFKEAFEDICRYEYVQKLELMEQVVEGIEYFAVGRRNWLFAKSVRGADASALVYSITETALLNHLKPYAYLTYILDELRKMGAFPKEKELKKLLPWSEDLPEYCRTKLKK